jgi:type IV secretory pathway TrbD component
MEPMSVTSVAVVAQSLDSAAADLDDLVLWIIVGLAFLWVIAMAAETTLNKVKPVLMFIVVAALVGFLVIKAFTAL